MNDIYSFNKIHTLTVFDSTIQHLEKTLSQGIRGRLYKTALRLLRNRYECTRRMFYGVENKGNMIVGVIGYNSIRKHLAVCGYYTAEIRDKYYLRIADVYIKN